MPSILPGYEYDIFISYRQNDNRSDKWVTNFVNALKEELEATLKNPVSIYFDENPHDGLLETHQVDASLAKKLKCLVFIPIISQTYCDEKCFAWEHEFMPFIKMAKEDELGMNITLSNGNVVSRVLPVKIHDLDAEDQHTLEAVLDGPLRSIDFIYGVAGVNRPLRANEDDPSANLNKTYYRDQINKVANALKDIGVSILRQPDSNIPAPITASVPASEEPKPKNNSKALFAIIGVLLILVTTYFLYVNQKKGEITNYEIDKSIAVLPFVDMSPKQDQEYFSDGMTEEILNHLFKIGDLRVVSRTTVMGYKGTTKSVKEIGVELGVANILEGSVRKAGNRVRISVKLIDPVTDEQKMAENYDRDLTDILAIQSEVAQEIAKVLKAEINPDVKARIESPITQNVEALELYMRARNIGRTDLVMAEELLRKAISLDSNFVAAYTELGAVWLYKGIFDGYMDADEVVEGATPFLNKALLLNYDYALTHHHLASMKLFYEWDFEVAINEYNIANQLNPSDLSYGGITHLLIWGKFEEAITKSRMAYSVDHLANLEDYGKSLYFIGEYEEALKVCRLAMESDSTNIFGVSNLGLYLNLYEDVIKFAEAWLNVNQTIRLPVALGNLAVAYYHTNNDDMVKSLLAELKKKSQKSPVGSPAFYISRTYAQVGEIDLAFEWLNRAYEAHEVEMVWLKVEPLFEPLRSDPRWQEMLDKVGFPD